MRPGAGCLVRIAICLIGLLVACSPLAAHSSTPTSIPGALGREVFVSNCARCHGENAEGHVVEPAPALDASEHAWHHPDWQLQQFIHDGKYGPGPVRMPAFKDTLSDEQIGFVITYIKSLWTEEQRASQESMNQRSVLPTP